MKPRLVLLESSDIGARYSAEAAKSLGFDPLFLLNLNSYYADPRAQIRCFEHIECDTTSVEWVLGALSQVDGVEAITTFADTRLMIAAEAARILQVRGIDNAVIRLKDKGAVAKLVPEFSPASLKFDSSDIPFGQIANLMREPGNSGVFVKLALGAGALGTFTVKTFEEIELIPKKIKSMDLPPHVADGGWIAQSFVCGSLVSIEGYCLSGEPRFLGFTSRRKVGATESAARFPIDKTLPVRIRDRAQAAVRTLIWRSGFRNGYFHIEFIINEQDCYLIDANMGRVGGGAIAEQLAISFGTSPLQVFKHILEITLFGKEESDLYTSSPKESYAIFYGLDHRDRVQDVTVPLSPGCFHTQILDRGTEVPPMGENDWSWVGILAGPALEAEQAIQKTRVKTETGLYAPCY